MPTDALFASIVIPTCNRTELLARCLDAVEIALRTAGARDDVEVIVTDDGDDDTSRTALAERYPWAIWQRGPRRGPAANRNSGARAARGLWLVFTDDDCIPRHDWLAALLERARAATSNVLEGKTVADRERRRLDEESPENPTGGYLWSCNMGIRRSVFDRLGGFCETFPYAAMEDVDLRLRILDLGERLEFVPSAVVCHPLRRTKGLRFARRSGESWLHLVEKHPSLIGPSPWRTMLLRWLRLASAALKGGVRYRFRGFPYAAAALAVAVYYDVVAAVRAGRRAQAAVAALETPARHSRRAGRADGTSAAAPAPQHDRMSLTFCIPSFGRAKFLLETLESIRSQTRPCRAIVCFGGRPPDAVRVYAERHDWVHLIALDPDPGMVACWQAAADHVTTEFLTFLADDNTLEPAFADTLVNRLAADLDSDFVFCNQQHLGPEGTIDAAKTENVQRLFGRDRLPEGPIANERLAELIANKSIPLEASVFRRSTWRAHRPFYPAAKGSFDIEFLFRLLLLGCRPYFVPRPLMNFRWHSEAYSARSRQEHVQGGVATYARLETLATGELRHVIRRARLSVEARLLRIPMPFRERLNLSLRLVGDGEVLGAAKQNLARLLGKPC